MVTTLLALNLFHSVVCNEFILFDDTLSNSTNFDHSTTGVEFVSGSDCPADGRCAALCPPDSSDDSYLLTNNDAITTTGFTDIRLEIQLSVTAWVFGSFLGIEWIGDVRMKHTLDTFDHDDLSANTPLNLSYALSSTAQNNYYFAVNIRVSASGGGSPCVYIDRVSVFGVQEIPIDHGFPTMVPGEEQVVPTAAPTELGAAPTAADTQRPTASPTMEPTESPESPHSSYSPRSTILSTDSLDAEWTDVDLWNGELTFILVAVIVFISVSILGIAVVICRCIRPDACSHAAAAAMLSDHISATNSSENEVQIEPEHGDTPRVIVLASDPQRIWAGRSRGDQSGSGDSENEDEDEDEDDLKLQHIDTNRVRDWRHWSTKEVFHFIMHSVPDGALEPYRESIKRDIFEREYSGMALEGVTLEHISLMGIKKVQLMNAVYEAVKQLREGVYGQREGKEKAKVTATKKEELEGVAGVATGAV